MVVTLAHPDPDEPTGELGDLQLGADGNLILYDGAASIQQRVVEALRFWRGEWFLQVAGGVPYFERVFRRPAMIGLISVELTEVMLAVDGVAEVLDVQAVIDPATRVLRWRASYRDDAGFENVVEIEV